MGAETPRAILLGMLKRERGLDTQTVARLADGSHRYLCAPESRRGGQDEWSTRANQALRFDSKVAAEKVAAGLSSNSAAKEYLAFKL